MVTIKAPILHPHNTPYSNPIKNPLKEPSNRVLVTIKAPTLCVQLKGSNGEGGSEGVEEDTVRKIRRPGNFPETPISLN